MLYSRMNRKINLFSRSLILLLLLFLYGCQTNSSNENTPVVENINVPTPGTPESAAAIIAKKKRKKLK